jgi:hypothetical protein
VSHVFWLTAVPLYIITQAARSVDICLLPISSRTTRMEDGGRRRWLPVSVSHLLFHDFIT